MPLSAMRFARREPGDLAPAEEHRGHDAATVADRDLERGRAGARHDADRRTSPPVDTRVPRFQLVHRSESPECAEFGQSLAVELLGGSRQSLETLAECHTSHGSAGSVAPIRGCSPFTLSGCFAPPNNPAAASAAAVALSRFGRAARDDRRVRDRGAGVSEVEEAVSRSSRSVTSPCTRSGTIPTRFPTTCTRRSSPPSPRTSTRQR